MAAAAATTAAAAVAAAAPTSPAVGGHVDTADAAAAQFGGLGYNPLGPGDSLTWPTVDPALVGLSADSLSAAVAGIGGIATPFCLAVVKHGALVIDHVSASFGGMQSPRLQMRAFLDAAFHLPSSCTQHECHVPQRGGTGDGI